MIYEDPSNTLILQTTQGDVVIQLDPKMAPHHVQRIKELTLEKSYDNVIFHRVIDGFMAQTGDVQFGNESHPNFDSSRAGMGGSSKSNLPAEFSNVPHKRGTVSMARSQMPNSANSQFFICLEDASWLDGQYSIFGQVIHGMENVDKIKKGEPVKNPDKIVRAYLAESNLET